MSESVPPASPGSESSLESIQPYDKSKVKCGAGALQPSAIDPLRHEDLDYFWSVVDKHFYPITTGDANYLRSIPVNPFGAHGDEALLLPPVVNAKRSARERGNTAAIGSSGKDAPSVPLTALPCDPAVLNSYPLTHRLVAALIDEGGGGTPSSAIQRPARGSAPDIDHFWPGIGPEPELRTYQKALDARVGIELREAGLLAKAEVGDELQASMRLDQWKLRDMKTSNRARKSSLYTLIVGSEFRRQAFSREHKKYMDGTEIAYLERMIKKLKKNKKARNKYPKLLAKMFKNYKPRSQQQSIGGTLALGGPGASSGGGGVLSSAGGGGSSSAQGGRSSLGGNANSGAGEDRPAPKSKSAKKKKRKSDASRPPTSKSAAAKGKQHLLDDNLS